MSYQIENGISVVMPAYNLAKYIKHSLESVLNQTHTDLELIVVNDCSTDETGDLIEKLACFDSRVNVYHNRKNLGGAGARNVGLAAARFRYIAFIDGDDIWHPEKLKKQMETLKNSDVQLSYTAVQKIDSSGKAFGAVQQIAPVINYDGLLSNPLIACSSVLLDYDAVGRVLMPEIRKRQDFAFWLKLLRKGIVARGINEPLTYYRVRHGSLSSNKLSAARYTWQVYRSHEGLPFWRALPNFLSYAFRGMLKKLNL